ncbi:2-dehydro-3-deoxy-D-gluconate 5-dehydrogenase [Jannaschia seosinensis]|uniref:2-dehydro-3-deoxy-D-gluconate 5-dehydrogenase n=1 Tax=Jannaschia seosinensis TaxID=313367 RepID=A0A0M7BDB2_9RHOB|nr:2-dehydro-3-deoxy-D-gluconate 5-dehydrogenase [Jannaschia seosinensis]
MTMPTYPDLAGASVFITGGGSGIGAALTAGFLRQGAKVALVGRSDYRRFVPVRLGAAGNAPLFVRCDVTDTAGLRAAMDAAAEAHGPITRLVNNAANDQRHDTLDVDEEFYDWSQSINLKSHFFACQPDYTTPTRSRLGTTRFRATRGVSGPDRIHRRTSSKPVRNQDFEQYPCFFRAGYLCPMSWAAARQMRAMAIAVMAMSRDNLDASVRRVSSRFSPRVLLSANRHSMSQRFLYCRRMCAPVAG